MEYKIEILISPSLKLNVKIEIAVVPRFWAALGDKCRKIHHTFHSKAFFVGKTSVHLFHFPTSGKEARVKKISGQGKSQNPQESS